MDTLPSLIDALDEALEATQPSGALCREARAALDRPGDEAERDVLANLLAQHALLRGETDLATSTLGSLPRAAAVGYRAALHLVAGELREAGPLLDEAVLEPAADLGAVAPILAIALLARDAPAATKAARRLVTASAGRGAKGAASALRKLVTYMRSPPDKRERIDVHRLGGAGPWELLLSALNVALHVPNPTTRASWAHVLVGKHAAWSDAGYAWLARQALFFAHEIDEAQCRKDLVARGLDPRAPLSRAAREIDLSSLIAPKPEWERTLEALSEVARSLEATSDVDYRVAWYLEMSDGSFARPALQEYRPGAGGWSAGQRVSIEELFARAELLPPEDVRILASSRADALGRRTLPPDAHELLVGHPRVFNGARGDLRVEVVRGACRLVVADDPGYVAVRVEPEGARLGVNVRPEGEARLVVYRVSKAMARVIEAMPRGLRVPKSRADEVSRLLDALGESVPIEGADRGAEETRAADSTPCVRFSQHAGAWLVELGVHPFGGTATTTRGRFFVAGVGRPTLHVHVDGRRVRIARDLAAEAANVARLVASCETLARPRDDAPPEDAHAWILGEAEVLSLLTELASSPEPHELAWREARVSIRGTLTARRLNARLRSIKGWYLATGGYRIDDVTEVALGELIRAPALAAGRFLRLPTGDYVEVEARVRRVLEVLRRTGEQIPPAAVGALRALADVDSGVDVDAAARAWIERADAASRADAPVPPTLAATLRPYQLEGFRWLARFAELGIGACLADDMGLGKTVQVLALLLTRKSGPHLVVAPTSVSANWAREIARFAPSLRVLAYVGKDRAARLEGLADAPPTVVIASYALLHEDEDALAAVSWDTVVLDEAQFIKNAHALRARAAFRLSARQRVALTGTPVENHFGDLWSIFHFLNPGLLGTWKDFQRRFVKPVERAGERAPEAVLREWIGPYVLRRLKSDVLDDLPPITEVQHDVALSKDEAVRYALLRKQIHGKLFTPHGKRGSKLEVLAEITRLRRFCCHPRLVFPDADVEGTKVTALLDLATELRENGHRALVFSQYVDFLTIVREALDERGIAYEYLDGSTPEASRQARVDAFQDGTATLFLATLKAGGFGVNLTAADYVIHLDPWWNPAVLAQATDRAHRIGQSRPVTVYSLITKHTIEEQIVALHQKKQRLADAVLEGASAAAELSIDDLVRLLEAR
ncbi:MAG: DEAD/DEAH box helicase [Polyangiaceae bacterium]